MTLVFTRVFFLRVAIMLLCIHSLIACKTATVLMDTPNIYVNNEKAFSQIPESLRSTEVSVIYGTDRAAPSDPSDLSDLSDLSDPSTPPTASAPQIEYTYQRSHALSAGVAKVSLDAKASWEELLVASVAKRRDQKFHPKMIDVQQKTIWPPSNNRFIPVSEDSLDIKVNPEIAAREVTSSEDLCGCVKDYGGVSEPQPVFLFIHGFNTDFEYAAVTMAQIWHFLGRTGVPAIYSWPAGRGGARGYMFDRESGEFTIFHLKQYLRALAACPSVSEINIIAHSRGSDVALSALRELNQETRGTDADTRNALKLNHVVLAAPDLDMQVVSQRVAAEGLLGVPKHFVIYISPDDRAILLATFLFSSVKRIGMLKANDLEPQQQVLLENMPRLEVIQTDINRVNFIGHDYFYTDPAVSSDLILLLRENKIPGPERPLEKNNGMYVLKRGYPEFDSNAK